MQPCAANAESSIVDDIETVALSEERPFQEPQQVALAEKEVERTSQRQYQGNEKQEVALDQVKQWILELETTRDEMLFVSVKNAVLLDSLAMAGECTGS